MNTDNAAHRIAYLRFGQMVADEFNKIIDAFNAAFHLGIKHVEDDMVDRIYLTVFDENDHLLSMTPLSDEEASKVDVKRVQSVLRYVAGTWKPLGKGEYVESCNGG